MASELAASKDPACTLIDAITEIYTICDAWQEDTNQLFDIAEDQFLKEEKKFQDELDDAMDRLEAEDPGLDDVWEPCDGPNIKLYDPKAVDDEPYRDYIPEEWDDGEWDEDIDEEVEGE